MRPGVAERVHAQRKEMELGILLVALAVALVGWLRAANDRDKYFTALGEANRRLRTLEEFYRSITGQRAYYNGDFKLTRQR